jgi:hypothetical protein
MASISTNFQGFIVLHGGSGTPPAESYNRVTPKWMNVFMLRLADYPKGKTL